MSGTPQESRSHIPSPLATGNQKSGYWEDLPRNSLLPLFVPLFVVSGVVMDRELGVGGIAAHSAIGHGGWVGDGFWDSGLCLS